MEENQVPVKLNDVEWRQRSEDLARAELTRDRQQADLDEEQEEWKDRKKYLQGMISATESRIRVLAREVDTREAMVDAQQTLPGAEPPKEPEPEVPAPEPGQTQEDVDDGEPDDREPGEEG